MFDRRLARHHLKRFFGSAAAVAAVGAVFFNTAADDLRLQRQLDNDYAELMLAPENDLEAPVLVNINTASLHHLQRLKGIGETKARAIVEYREEHGGFLSAEELTNVSGIGANTLEEIRGQITV